MIASNDSIYKVFIDETSSIPAQFAAKKTPKVLVKIRVVKLCVTAVAISTVISVTMTSLKTAVVEAMKHYKAVFDVGLAVVATAKAEMEAVVSAALDPLMTLSLYATILTTVEVVVAWTLMKKLMAVLRHATLGTSSFCITLWIDAPKHVLPVALRLLRKFYHFRWVCVASVFEPAQWFVVFYILACCFLKIDIFYLILLDHLGWNFCLC